MNIRDIYAAAALCVCVAVFFSACGKGDTQEETTEVSVFTPWSEAQVFTMPQEQPGEKASKTQEKDETEKKADSEKADPEAESAAILKRIADANAVYGLFSVSKPQLDKKDSKELEEGLIYYRVSDPKLDTMDKLYKYVCGYFSEEITNKLMNVGMYASVDGKLYAIDVGKSSAAHKGTPTVEVTEKTKTSESYRLVFSGEPENTYDYVYSKGKDGKWVFTAFQMY